MADKRGNRHCCPANLDVGLMDNTDDLVNRNDGQYFMVGTASAASPDSNNAIHSDSIHQRKRKIFEEIDSEL